MDMVSAFTVDADVTAKFKEKNLLSIVPNELKKKKYDVLVMQSGCNEISNLNCQTSPENNYSYWEQTVYQSSEKMYDLAIHCVSKFPGMKAVILPRLARYDLTSADPHGIKNKLSEYGNGVLTTLWVKNGCPKNITIGGQNLSCYGELRSKRFGLVDSPGYDGIHMRGPLGSQHYTNATLRIFQEVNPALQTKPFPKFTKPLQSNNSPPPFNPHVPPPPFQGQSKPVPTKCRHFDDRQNDNSGHKDCPQSRYQSGQGYLGSGFNIPTQNRFATFYNNSKNV